jgi:hypothetical protein
MKIGPRDVLGWPTLVNRIKKMEEKSANAQTNGFGTIIIIIIIVIIII